MFQVRNIDGVFRPHQPGEIRARRKVQPVIGAQGAVGVSTLEGSHDHVVITRTRLTSNYQSDSQGLEKKEVRFASEIMSSPVFSIPPSMPMSEVGLLFTRKRFRHFPVCREDGELVGLISDRLALSFAADAESLNVGRTAVSAVMVGEVLTATPDTLIRDLARTLIEERIGSLPIITTDAQLIGIVTRSDILRSLLIHGPLQIWA